MELFKSSEEIQACPFFNVIGLQSQTLTPLISASCESVLKESLDASLVKMTGSSIWLPAILKSFSLAHRERGMNPFCSAYDPAGLECPVEIQVPRKISAQ